MSWVCLRGKRRRIDCRWRRFIGKGERNSVILLGPLKWMAFSFPYSLLLLLPPSLSHLSRKSPNPDSGQLLQAVFGSKLHLSSMRFCRNSSWRRNEEEESVRGGEEMRFLSGTVLV